jgi:hypothetical protein
MDIGRSGVYGLPTMPCEIVSVIPHQPIVLTPSATSSGVSHTPVLLPGDLIFTGTPAGIGATRQPAQFLRPGQVLSSYIDGVGTMANRLIAPPTQTQR